MLTMWAGGQTDGRLEALMVKSTGRFALHSCSFVLASLMFEASASPALEGTEGDTQKSAHLTVCQ